MKKSTFLAFILIVGFTACNGQVSISTAQVVQTPAHRPSVTKTILSQQLSTSTAPKRLEDCDGNLIKQVSTQNFSPNHLWRFIFCVDPKTGFTYTQVIRINDAKSWRIPFYETFGAKIQDKSFLDGLKDTLMNIAHWSADGNYLYLYPEICCIDGSTFFNGFPAIYQLDLHTGELKDMLISGDVGFSPDDKYLSYRTLPVAVHLRNLEKDEDVSILVDEKYVNLGAFSWSPDSNQLVFVAALEDWDKNMYEPTPISQDGFSLLLLNSKTLKITTLIDNDIRMFMPGSASYYESDNSWADNDRMYLAQRDITGRNEANVWLFDINKRELIPFFTPTPTP